MTQRTERGNVIKSNHKKITGKGRGQGNNPQPIRTLYSSCKPLNQPQMIFFARFEW